MVRIKVCGITNREDAFLAVDLGVDALGFIFAPSPRRITPEQARRIIKNLPPFVDRVGVFVNEKKSKVEEIAQFCSLTTLQFHGEESPSYCSSFSCKKIKSFAIKDKLPPDFLSYKVDAYLLDTFSEDKKGGTGKTFNLDVAKEAKKFDVPLIIAGGLSPENVGEVIRKVHPFAVDVASGVEESPGKKSKEKLKRFIKQVRETDEALQTS